MTRAAAGAALAWLTITAAAQTPAGPSWRRANVLPSLNRELMVPMTYDIARERTVMLRMEETWEWDGSSWSRRDAFGPANSSSCGLAYDPVGRQSVLFGDFRAETWLWDGAAWRQQTPATSPWPRDNPTMGTDPLRGRVVLFSGEGAVYSDDTWEWDGSTWTRMFPIHRPQRRYSAAMAFDLQRGQLVMFGGALVHNVLAPMFAYDDTWEWDGVDWMQRFPGNVPPARRSHAMAYDIVRGRTVMFGGCSDGLFAHADEWEWNGTDWTQVAPTPLPNARCGAAMAYDWSRAEVVMHGGVDLDFVPVTDTWRRTAAGWAQVHDLPSPPSTVSTVAYDKWRDRIVLWGCDPRGNHPETWEWDGERWYRFPGQAEPPARKDWTMCFDSIRKRTVLYGGSSLTSWNSFNDTWEWDGLAWTQRQLPQSPSSSVQGPMAFDSSRGRVVLCAGVGPLVSAQTWEYDGQTWQRVPSAVQAPAGFAMAYDDARQRIVMTVSIGLGAPIDVWEYDGSNWFLVPRPTKVPAFSHIGANPFPGGLTYDPARQRSVLVGHDGSGSLTQTWEWDGAVWVRLRASTERMIQPAYPVAWDAVRQHIVTFDAYRGGTWILDDTPRASRNDYGSGCGGPAGAPRLAGNEPYLGNAGFTLEVHGVPATACAVGFSLASGNVALGAGCTLHIGPLLFGVVGVGNGQGVASIRLPVARAAALGGLSVFAQAAVLDPQGPLNGLAFSQGRQLTFGN